MNVLFEKWGKRNGKLYFLLKIREKKNMYAGLDAHPFSVKQIKFACENGSHKENRKPVVKTDQSIVWGKMRSSSDKFSNSR